MKQNIEAMICWIEQLKRKEKINKEKTDKKKTKK